MKNQNITIMKNFFLKLTFVASMFAMFALTSCELENNKSFDLSVKEVGPEYVEVLVKGGDVVRMAYMIDTKQQLMNSPHQLFKNGTEVTVPGGEVLRISAGIKENTTHYLYAVAALSDTEFSEIITLPFTTTEYDLSELVTVVDQFYDGYKVRLTLPKETKDRGNAIRYNQCCIMMYNYMMQTGGNDYSSLLYNGQAFTTEDKTVVYSEDTNWYETGDDSDGNGEIDWDTKWNPISPGEPIVFVAGEFSWMEDTKEYDNEFFMFPGGWPNGYYLPMINTDYYKNGGRSQSSMGVVDWGFTHPMDQYWTGAFQRKHFLIRQPDVLEASVDVKCVDASPINLTMEFYPEEGVDQYAFGVFDDNTYQNQILPLLNGNPDYMQWAVTSYFAAYTFGTKVASGPVRADLTTFYYQDAIKEDTKYHVFVTAMGNQAGTAQSFRQYTFSTTSKVLDEPVIEVTPVMDETTPFRAAFNIKCTTYQDNPVVQAFYAANYVRDWELALNGGATYFSLLNGNNQFSSTDLEKINSEEGLTTYIASVDGEATRFAVLAYNSEFTPNDVTTFQYIEDCPAVATVTTPYYSDYFAEEIPWISAREFEPFLGEWTATATLKNGSTDTRYVHKSKVTLADNLDNYPSTLPADVYALYEEVGGKEKDEVDAFYAEFKELAEVYAEKRLANMNRILGTGWLDDDSYDRLSLRTPYDLFIAKDYSSVDVSSIYNDFGPKWYLEAYEDPETYEVLFRIPVDQNLLPPAAAWSVPFYMAALDPDTYQAFTAPQVAGELFFPVEYDEENDVVVIKPFEYNGVKYYPNILGYDASSGGSILENPVVSEIVLTRGWIEPEVETKSAARGAAGNVPVRADLPKGVYKKMTELKPAAELQEIQVELVSGEQIKERADKLVERFLNQTR